MHLEGTVTFGSHPGGPWPSEEASRRWKSRARRNAPRSPRSRGRAVVPRPRHRSACNPFPFETPQALLSTHPRCLDGVLSLDEQANLLELAASASRILEALLDALVKDPHRPLFARVLPLMLHHSFPRQCRRLAADFLARAPLIEVAAFEAVDRETNGPLQTKGFHFDGGGAPASARVSPGLPTRASKMGTSLFDTGGFVKNASDPHEAAVKALTEQYAARAELFFRGWQRPVPGQRRDATATLRRHLKRLARYGASVNEAGARAKVLCVPFSRLASLDALRGVSEQDADDLFYKSHPVGRPASPRPRPRPLVGLVEEASSRGGPAAARRPPRGGRRREEAAAARTPPPRRRRREDAAARTPPRSKIRRWRSWQTRSGSPCFDRDSEGTSTAVTSRSCSA